MLLHLIPWLLFRAYRTIPELVAAKMFLEIVVIHSSADTIRTLHPSMILHQVLFECCGDEKFVALRACERGMFLEVLSCFRELNLGIGAC